MLSEFFGRVVFKWRIFNLRMLTNLHESSLRSYYLKISLLCYGLSI